MVEPTEDRGLPDRPDFGRFDSSRHRTLLLQPEMRATLVVVTDVFAEDPVQMPVPPIYSSVPEFGRLKSGRRVT